MIIINHLSGLAQDNNLLLNWEKQENVNGYIIYHGIKPNKEFNKYFTTNNYFILQNDRLIKDSTNYFSVQSTNQFGISKKTSEETIFVFNKPNKIRDLYAKVFSNNKYIFYWEKDLEEEKVDSYEVYVKINNFWVKEIETTDEFIIGSFNSTNKVSYKVIAKNKWGKSDFSREILIKNK